VSTASAEARGLTTRFLIVEYDGDRAELEAGLRANDPGVPMRFRSPSETRVFRHGDAVLPLAEVEARFGPLIYRDEAGGRLSIDRAWTAEHLAVRNVPGLGEIRCHRDVLDDVTSALGAVSGAARATVAGGAAVCFDPHRGEPGLGPSRHAYGIAIAFALRGEIAPEVVDAFEEHGFTWGGRWLDPEPNRFEWVGR
jgi:hypothetical protein